MRAESTGLHEGGAVHEGVESGEYDAGGVQGGEHVRIAYRQRTINQRGDPNQTVRFRKQGPRSEREENLKPRPLGGAAGAGPDALLASERGEAAERRKQGKGR